MHVCRPYEEDHETLPLVDRAGGNARQPAGRGYTPGLVVRSGEGSAAAVRQLLTDPRGLCRQLGLSERALPQPQAC
jgi:hypothetical protein